MSKRVLVSGATGYIAGRLIPRLLDAGYNVRALARKPHLLRARAWFDKVSICQADVMNPDSLVRAMAGVHTAYYLIHNMSLGRGYTDVEIQGAKNFAAAAAQAGVQHIIYLGGLADPDQHIAAHMRSRIETGNVLRKGPVPVTEFRAGVIAGSGSISFEMIRFMTELLPVVPGPLWLMNKSQPVTAENVVDYLLAALKNPNGQGQVFEIGSREVYTYKELMQKYASARGLKRKFLLLPCAPVWFMALGIDLFTPVPYPIAHALVEGLSADSVVKQRNAEQIFPEIVPGDFESAAREVLRRMHPANIERVWDDGLDGIKSLKHEGFFIRHAQATLGPRQQVNPSINKIYEDKHGAAWLERRVDENRLTQTLYYAPHGSWGFIRWLLIYPFAVIKFWVLWRGVKK